MSAQFKIDQPSLSNKTKEVLDNQKKHARPNIDHLLKRISQERKEEKKNILITVAIVIIAIGVFSYFIV
jgi:hypothetical protein|tara:strand:+ start:2361 stop:2567 length:207 start_codon:yes stop_codon:yes gene_type:complete